MRAANIERDMEPTIGYVPSLLLGAGGTIAVVAMARALPLLPEHAGLMGHMMTLAPRLAMEQGCNPYPDGGFRVMVNTGTEGGQEVHHLHMHVIGGPRPWRKG